MLSIGVMASGQGRYYSELAREDYYVLGGEPTGRWWGKGAERFGLTGKEVTAQTLDLLMDGYSPKGIGLVQNAGDKQNKERRPGFDLTFSAPKTVSAVWALASPEAQKEIQAAQDTAVKAALAYLEKTGTFTRTGKGGTERHQAGMVVSLFEHGTSRALDPQLHTHALLMNLGVMEDGRVRALVHTEFFARKMAAGAVYRVELAAELQKRLGLTIEQDPNAFKKGGLGFKVAGVSDSLCDFWSKRRDAIEAQLGKWGIETAAAAAAAARSTRETKGIVPPRGELFERWRDEAKSVGLLPQILNRYRGQPTFDVNAAFEGALAKTLRELTAAPESRLEAKTIGGRLTIKMVDSLFRGEDERAFGLSHFSETLLLRHLAENCQGIGIDAKTLLDKYEEAVLKSPHLIRLGKAKSGEELLTTPETLKLEEQMLAAAEKLHFRRGHGIDDETVTKAIEKYNGNNPMEALGPQREDAIRYLTDKDRGSIRCLEGWAGTAKSTTLAIVKELYEKQGYKVIGTAVAGKAVKALRDSGKPSFARQLSPNATIHHVKQLVRAARNKKTEKYEPHKFKNAYTLKRFEMLTGSIYARWFKHVAIQVFREARGKSTFKFEPVRLNQKTVVICDEASMVETRQMEMLNRRITEAGGLLILAGEREQIQAVGQGGGFANIADKVGKALLTDIVRQKKQQDRDAVKDVREGRSGKMLEDFAERKLLDICKDRDATIEKLVNDWMKYEKGRKQSESLIFVGTRADAKTINQKCQHARIDNDKLGSLVRTSSRGQTYYRFDRVLFNLGSRTIGVVNGETGTIVGINPTPFLKTLTIKIDGGKKVVVPLRDYKHLSLGYAVTTHKGQGSTVERAYVLLGGDMQHKEISYVQASRAKHETRLYASQADAGENNKELAKQMANSHAKTLATHEANLARRAQAEQEMSRQQHVPQRTIER